MSSGREMWFRHVACIFKPGSFLYKPPRYSTNPQPSERFSTNPWSILQNPSQKWILRDFRHKLCCWNDTNEAYRCTTELGQNLCWGMRIIAPDLCSAYNLHCQNGISINSDTQIHRLQILRSREIDRLMPSWHVKTKQAMSKALGEQWLQRILCLWRLWIMRSHLWCLWTLHIIWPRPSIH